MKSRITAVLAVLVVVSIAVGCDKVALLAPTQSTITLSVNSTSVAANGTVEVTATVIEQAGTAVHNGTEVTFTSSVGTLEPRVARTEGGIARTTFRAGTTSGTAKISAFSGAARATDVELLVGGAAASTVVVRTDPASVTPNGGTVNVIATVRDVSGNPLPGAQVVFTADNGTLGSNGATTDANGEARTTLATSRQTVVRASVAGKEGQATINLVNLPNVGLTASTNTPAVGVPVTFTITPGTVTNGNPVQSVTFDPGDGSPVRTLGTGTTSFSHTYTSAGTFTATATITDNAGNRGVGTATITAQRSQPTATVTASPSTANVGDPVTFTINSTAGANGPAIQSVQVTFPDGQSVTVGPGSQTLVRSFGAPGTYVVRARATDQAGTVSSDGTTSVIIRERAALEVNLEAFSNDPAVVVDCFPRDTTTFPKTCTATGFSLVQPPPPTAPLRVAFRAATTGVVSPDNIVRYTWNFDDGTTETTMNRTTDHVFQRNRTYVVTVTVTTAAGSTGNGRVTLIVQ
ncbi:MAG TPA: PKD domain-containing protein [Vicinamibacterales bacterium]|nr:PKD domain-containing protein [Vicinamibacterales bacterium]